MTELSTISKRVAKSSPTTLALIENKELEVSGKNLKEVKKIFDKLWEGK